MDKEADDAYEAHALRCHACAARERLASKRAKQNQDEAGLMYGVTRRE